MRAFRPFVLLMALWAVVASAQASPGAAPPAIPEVSVFYYPWYGTPARDGGWIHWTKPGTTSFASNYFPARGLYSSADARVVRVQMREIAAAGVQEVVSSWWGRGSREDQRLPLVIGAARSAGVAVAAHLEPYPGRDVLSVQSDLEHLQALGIRRVFVYHPFDISDDDWAALRASVRGVQLFAETGFAGRAAAAHFDGIYTYDVLRWGGGDFDRICKAAHKLRLLCLPSVGPGFEALRATGDKHVKPRRDGKTYDSMWKGAIHADPDGVTITSYNGAYGTHGKAAQRAYLDRTRFWVRAFVRSQRPEEQLPSG